MALLLKKTISAYLYAERELADPRTQDWFLVRNTWLIFGLVAFYNYFVLSLGPKLMKNQKPFELKYVLVVYNVVQVILSLYIFKEALCMYLGYSWVCQPVDFSTSPEAMRAANGVWLYYMVKVIDLLDTVFFVLRKKDNQVSFLHVYHHSGMVLTGHFGTKYFSGGHSIYVGLVNCAVHAVMYTYYLLTSWDPKYKKSIWWKKHITQMQIVQFFLLILHLIQPIYHQCGYPIITAVILVPQNLFMFILFTDFYIKAYIKKKPQTKKGEGNERNEQVDKDKLKESTNSSKINKDTKVS